MSPKALIFCEGIWLAHTARPLQVARALRAGGWDVEFGAHGRFSSLPVSEGFQVHSVSTMDPERAIERIRNARIGYDRRTVELYVEDERTVIRRVAPDVILNDFRLPVAISARLEGVPFANILNAYWTNHYAPRQRSPEDFILTRLLGKRFTSAIMPSVVAPILRLYARPFNAVAKSCGLETFGNIYDVMDSPHLNLICDLEEFMPMEGQPERFKYIGPIMWEPSVEPPDWLERVDPGRPSIYFSMGSTGFAHYYDVLRRAFEGTEFQVLLTTGGADAGEMPENFFVAALAPALGLIERCRLVICHGGNGTIYQALSRGVPVLGIPTFHDQDFNMQRVEDLGLGAALYPRGLTPQLLCETAERLMGDEAVRASCGVLGEKIREANAPARAVEHITELLSPTS